MQKITILVIVALLCASVLAIVPQTEEPFDVFVNSSNYVPVVLWHGMGDTCCFPWSMGRIKKLIEKTLPGIYVYSIMVGNDIIQDEIAGFFGNVNDQIKEVSQDIANNVHLSNGFNAVGFSQGGQFLRALLEQYNNPRMFQLITMGGQHQGVFGIPDCSPNYTLCEDARRLINLGVYLPEVQNLSVQAQYWHDPINTVDYVQKNIFLPKINNQGYNFTSYKQNILSLDNFVMVKFLNDTMVIPSESEWFGYYVAGQDQKVIPLQQTALYLEDWLGLRQLDSQGKLVFLGCEGNHLQFSDQYFIDNIIYPYLNVTFASRNKRKNNL